VALRLLRGKNKGEWRGIVDVLAIRKDTSQPAVEGLKRGDLFDIILIQLKGGSARRPTLEEKHRLKEVANSYSAKEVVLFEWKRGKVTAFYTLGPSLEWNPTTSSQLFG
jgi:hypothetical protein